LRLLVGDDVDHRFAREQAGRDDLVLLLVLLDLVAVDDLLPDAAAGGGNEIAGLGDSSARSNERRK